MKKAGKSPVKAGCQATLTKAGQLSRMQSLENVLKNSKKLFFVH